MIDTLEPRTKTRVLNVALLGCGVVGSEVARLLIEQRHEIAERSGIDVRLKRILVRDCGRDRGIDRRLLTDRFEDVLRSDVDAVIEVLGGLEPAGAYVERLLASGVNVISANKTLIAHRGEHLARVAADNGTTLAYEASVCAAVPVLSALGRMKGDAVRSITGIVNGACNYILTRMTEAAISLEDAVKEARERGLVEPDASADLSGRDSAEKLCILASIAGFGSVSPSEVSVRGIEGITRSDVLAARRQGCVIKLIASANIEDGSLVARVCPTFVPERHALAAVKQENNALTIQSDLGGELLLQGKGAGPRPTAAAILSDLLQSAPSQAAASGLRVPGLRTCIVAARSASHLGRFFVRLPVIPELRRPERFLTVLQQLGIAITDVELNQEELTIVTRETTVSQVEAAIAALSCRGSAAFAAEISQGESSRGRLVEQERVEAIAA